MRFALLLLVVGLATSAPQPTFAEGLPPGESLDGFSFKTHLDIPFASRSQAEEWLHANPDLKTARVHSDESGHRVRLERRYENVLQEVVGQDAPIGSQTFEAGVFTMGYRSSFASEAEAREAAASGGLFPMEGTRILGVRQDGHRFWVEAEQRLDLLSILRNRTKLEALGMKSVVRHVPGFEGVATGRYDPKLYFSSKREWDFTGYTVRALHPDTRGAIRVEVGTLEKQIPLRHALYSRLLRNGPVTTEDRAGSRLFVSRRRGLENTIHVGWLTDDDRYVVVDARREGKYAKIVEAYIEKYPVARLRPGEEVSFEAWLSAEIAYSIERLAWHASEDLRPRVYERLRQRGFAELKPMDDRSTTFNSELFAIERWVDTPVAVLDPARGRGNEQDRYDEAVEVLSVWWSQNREKIELRPNAPLQRAEVLWAVENGAGKGAKP